MILSALKKYNGKMKTIIFDLDDTLYEEKKYVLSGFKSTSEYIETKFNIDKNKIYKECIYELEIRGRGKIFDFVLKKNKIFSSRLVKKLVCAYRNHIPLIKPYLGVKETLLALRKRGIKLGIITDGLASVQRIKIKALNLENLFDLIIFTSDYGREHWKPSIYSYKKIIKYFKMPADQITYVGNNPHKDFLGANKLGIKTIRLLKGTYKDVTLPYPLDARFYITKIEDVLIYVNN